MGFRPKLLRAIAATLLLAGCGGANSSVFQGWIEAEPIFVSADEIGRIETLWVHEGDWVQLQAPLFRLDTELQQADVALQQASVKNAQQTYERTAGLLRSDVATVKAMEDAEAALRTAEARLMSSEMRLSRRRVSSPSEGVVQQVYYRAGEIVGPARPVLAVLPPANMKLRFFVGQATLPTLDLGQEVNISCDGCTAEVSARISYISPTSEFTPPVIYSAEERQKLTFLIEARTEHPELLRVGQPVTVTIPHTR